VRRAGSCRRRRAAQFVLACGGPANPRSLGLAGGSGDRSGAALGDGLLDGVDAVQDRTDLCDDLSEVDLADAGHGGKQPGLGVAEQAGGEGSVEVGDGGKQVRFVSVAGGGERERLTGRQESVSLHRLRSEPTWENGS
jgi:hypothetical protein